MRDTEDTGKAGGAPYLKGADGKILLLLCLPFNPQRKGCETMDSLQELRQAIDQFAQERQWTQFHTPANLAKSISIEANELLECFQWSESAYSLEHVKEELADVLNYCIRMASILELDIREIVLQKMEKNALKYPVEKARGNSAKYTQL